jgi:hypothetical protein
MKAEYFEHSKLSSKKFYNFLLHLNEMILQTRKSEGVR